MNIVITGGSKGIGYAIANKLLSEGIATSLAICSRSNEEIEAARSKLMAKYTGSQIIAFQCDVAIEEEVSRFASFVTERFGNVDVLINNAGFGKFATVHEMDTSTWEDVLGTNLRGVFLVTQAFISHMRKRKSGSIVTIGSLAGKNGFSGGAAYSAAKYAVRGLMQSLFLEIREDNVRVITLFPGSVDTHFFARAGVGPQMAHRALSADDIADAVKTALTLPQHADISELDIRPTNPKG